MNKWIAVVAMSMALGASAIHGQQGANKRPNLPGDFDPPRPKVVDLRQKLKEMQLKEGLNLIHTFDIGVRLWAKVKNGEIVGYVATNNQDNILPLKINRVKTDSQKQTLSKFEKAAKKHQEREDAWDAMREAMENADPITKGCYVISEFFSAEGDYIGFSEAYVDCPKGV